MKHSSLNLKLGGATLAAIVSSVLLAASAQAQTNLYFDPAGTGSGGDDATASATASGGSGIWDSSNTPDWYAASQGSDVGFFPPSSGFPSVANFDGVGGEVTVDGTFGAVQPTTINFGGSGTYTLDAANGGTISEAVNDAGAYSAGTFLTVSSGNVTINAPSNVILPSDSPGATITNSGSGTLTLNGAINVSGSTASGTSLVVNNTGGGALFFNSTVTNTLPSGASPQFFSVQFGGGTSEFNGNILGANTGFDPGSGSPTNDNLQVNGGATLLVDNGNFDRFQVIGGTLLTHGAVTVIAANSFTSNSGTLGGATADVSTFSGNIANFGGTQTLTAAAGGRVNFSGDIFGGGVGAGNNLVINGAGIVALTNANGNDYAVQYNGGSNTAVGTEIAHGTLLAENTNSGTSATGAGMNQNSTPTSSVGANNVVQIDNVTAPTAAAPVATLGGTGYLLQQVVALGANSAITPGDISKDGVVTPGTLHLFNGLSAVNGLTVNFTLTADPTTSSTIQISTTSINPVNGFVSNGAPAVALMLDGPITFNLSGTVNTDETYTLFSSAAGTAWDVDSATYTFNGVPAGFTAHEFVTTTDGTESLDVNFTANPIPEPATWALIGLGALVLIGSGKLRKLRA